MAPVTQSIPYYAAGALPLIDKPACLLPCMQTSEGPVFSIEESTNSLVWNR